MEGLLEAFRTQTKEEPPFLSTKKRTPKEKAHLFFPHRKHSLDCIPVD